VILRSKITGGSKPPPYGGELGDFAEQNHWREQAPRPTEVNWVILRSKITGGSKPPPYGGELGDFAEQNHRREQAPALRR